MEAQPDSQDTFALIERFQAGDKEALGTLIARHARRIVGIVDARLGAQLRARTAIEDVVQDVHLRIVRGMHRFERRGESHWIDWVACLVEHEIRNQARAAAALKRGASCDVRSMDAASQKPLEATSVSERAARTERETIVDNCVAQLTPDHRDVILLRDYEGHAWSEIREILGRPSPEACQELHRRARCELAILVRRAGITE